VKIWPQARPSKPAKPAQILDKPAETVF
jgi:hypothetical protein